MLPPFTRTSKHEIKIRDRLNVDLAANGLISTSQPLVILAFTNRCGSNLAADYLKKARLVGGLGEFLNFETVCNNADRLGFDTLWQYLSYLKNFYAKNNIPLGTKASFEQILMLFRWGIHHVFPEIKVIHVRRLDLVSQAVSFSIADQTKQWTSQQKAESTEVKFDLNDIEGRLFATAHANESIALLCGLLGLDRMEIIYEDLVTGPASQIARAAEFLGATYNAAKVIEPSIQKQANQTNQNFATMFTQYYRDKLRIS